MVLFLTYKFNIRILELFNEDISVIFYTISNTNYVFIFETY